MFIAFEGVEGAGKSSQVRLLENRLVGENYAVTTVQEPGTTALGQRLRSLLLNSKQADPPPTPLAEACLFAAARAELVTTVIRPALAAGRIVLCDRFGASTVAYQGAKGAAPFALEALNAVAVQGVRPNLTVLLDLDPKVGLHRKQAEGPLNAFEEAMANRLDLVRDEYLRLATQAAAAWLIVDARQAAEAIHRLIYEQVRVMLLGTVV